jgi:hypothetical protein
MLINVNPILSLLEQIEEENPCYMVPDDFDKCDCPCHYTPGMMHIMACCYTCPNCGKQNVVRSHRCAKN